MAKGGLATPKMLSAPPQLSQHTQLRMEQAQVLATRAHPQLSPSTLRPGKADSAARLLHSAAPGLAAGTLASAMTLAASVRRVQRPSSSQKRARGKMTRRRAAQDEESMILAQIQPRYEVAAKNGAKFNFSKLDTYAVEDLQELYIDSKWVFYNEGKKIIEDDDFDRLKEALRKRGSDFASLKRNEVAYIQASIAYYQGEPIITDEEYDALSKKVSLSGRRKDVTAFVLNIRAKDYLNKEQLGKMQEAFTLATQVDFKNLDDYSLAELEELYIDSLWCYYRERKPLIADKEYDALKLALYQRESRFPTLTQTEVAFVEASIAYFRGEPVVSDQEYDSLKAEVEAMGARKEVTAFLLYERGEQFLTTEQFEAMKDEYEKLGIVAVDLEQCSVAQMEEMYVDALWAYYKDGVQLLSDEQYDKLRMELQCQASGFPTLSKDQVEFVKATLSYWRGEPVATDEEWKALQKKVLQDGKRKDVTAFLLYSKGQETLDPQTFQDMKEEMEKLGMSVKKAGTKALENTLSITSDALENNLGQVVFMVSALGTLPTVLCTVLVWSVGLFLDLEFVPQAEWASVLTAEFLPLFAAGLVLGLLVTWRLLVFLDLQNPEILCGVCPSCGSETKLFSGGEEPPREVAFSCKECGCKMVMDTVDRKIRSAGLGAKIEGESQPSFDWSKAWQNMKSVSKEKVAVDA